MRDEAGVSNLGYMYPYRYIGSKRITTTVIHDVISIQIPQRIYIFFNSLIFIDSCVPLKVRKLKQKCCAILMELHHVLSNPMYLRLGTPALLTPSPTIYAYIFQANAFTFLHSILSLLSVYSRTITADLQS